ncbi:MAG: methyltransferase domain-containing protein [Acidobacteriota bacterium]
MAQTTQTPKPLFRFHLLAKVVITFLALGVFFVIRPDYLAPTMLRYNRYIDTPSLISNYIKEHQVRKLQIGSGDNNFDGWLNTEYETKSGQAFLDATLTFPLPDNSFNYVYSEHVLEHFDYWVGLDMLKEEYRVLKPGGRVRVVTPDLDKLIGLFKEQSPAKEQYVTDKFAWHNYWPKTADNAALILNLELHDFGHQFVYNAALLGDSLQKVGFKNVRVYVTGESNDPALANLEVRSGFYGGGAKRYESLSIEAEK